MTLKHALMATTAAVLLTAGVSAQAQQSAPANRDMPAATAPSTGANSSASLNASTLHEIKDAKVQISSMNGVTVKDLNDMAIYGSDGKKIGEIDRVLGDQSNSPKAVAVDAGGFLGMGKHEVIFPLDKLTKGKEAKRLQTAMTKDDVKALEKWDSASADVKAKSPTASGAGGQPATSVPKR